MVTCHAFDPWQQMQWTGRAWKLLSKMWFLWTNKHQQSFVQGIAWEETIKHCIGVMETEIHWLEELTNQSQIENGEPTQNLSTHYSIAQPSPSIVSIPHWITSNNTDPAFIVSANCFLVYVINLLHRGFSQISKTTSCEGYAEQLIILMMISHTVWRIMLIPTSSTTNFTSTKPYV